LTGAVSAQTELTRADLTRTDLTRSSLTRSSLPGVALTRVLPAVSRAAGQRQARDPLGRFEVGVAASGGQPLPEAVDVDPGCRRLARTG
jgi:hypothetical protein